MIYGHHLILSCDGFWLPNDPRGSGSDYVGAAKLYPFGAATKMEGNISRAHVPHDAGLRRSAKSMLSYPPVHLTGRQALAVGQGIKEYVERKHIIVWACAILPDHVHLVVQKSHLSPMSLAVQLKGAATRELIRKNAHPLESFVRLNEPVPNCWARGQRFVSITSARQLRHAIRYMEENPLKEGKPRQRWSFVRSCTIK